MFDSVQENGVTWNKKIHGYAEYFNSQNQEFPNLPVSKSGLQTTSKKKIFFF